MEESVGRVVDALPATKNEEGKIILMCWYKSLYGLLPQAQVVAKLRPLLKTTMNRTPTEKREHRHDEKPDAHRGNLHYY